MPSVRLRGLNKATKRLSTGEVVTYWYAWRGGPRLVGAPGSPEFLASLNQATQTRKTPSGDTLAALAGRYRASPEWGVLAESTRREWSRWLDRIVEDAPPALGGFQLDALNDLDVRRDILAWRDQWADRPRSADYAMQVLSRLLAWGVSRRELQINAAEGIDQLYANDRADQIWTPAEIERYAAAAPSIEVGFIAPLACLTGFRREDLATLAWAHVGGVAIVKPTLKSRGRKMAIVPLLAVTKELLAEIRAQQLRRHGELVARARKHTRPEPPFPTTVLSNTRGRPWTADGLEHQVIDTKHKAGVDKHLHDCRGTFATRLRRAGLTAPEIADILAWEEDRVERLLATYVDQESIVRAIAERIARNESGA